MEALQGVRVLDLTGGIAGPLGVLQLAEHGADVIKIEPLGGRTDRTSPASRVYNRSRRSVTLDLDTADGARLLREMAATADVIVEAFAPGRMADWGLDYESLHEQLPTLVYCSVPAWPSGMRLGNLPGYEALVQARTGQQWENTSFRPGPVFLQSPVASMGAMFLVPIGILSALLARDRTGRGQHVEVSLLQGVMAMTTQIWNWTDRGQFYLAKSQPPGIHQTSIYECADGQWVHASTMSGVAPSRSEASILGMDEIAPLALMSMPAADRERFDAQKREAYKRWDRTKLIDELHASGLGAEAIDPPHKRFDHPQLRETGAVVEVVDPDLGPTTQLGVTIFLEGTPGQVKGPQPPAGAHTVEMLRALGYDDAGIADLRQRRIV
jgi:crotonobetainyl-CoA:carnitine CoA-transferase CaiB-like acyl-CoA transferase